MSGSEVYARIALAMVGRSTVSFEVLKQWIGTLRQVHWPGPTFLMPEIYAAGHWTGVVPLRNLCTYTALRDPDWDYLLWIDADHKVTYGIFERCQEHARARLPIVCGLYYAREYPHEVQAFGGRTAGGVIHVSPGVLVQYFLTGQLPDGPTRRPMPQGAPLLAVAGGGTGCMLIRRDVLELMAERRTGPEDPDGTMSIWRADRVAPLEQRKLLERGENISGVMTEDILFCLDVADELGETVWLDLDARMETGHQGEITIDRRAYVAAHQLPPGVDPRTVKLPPGYHVQTRDDRVVNTERERARNRQRRLGQMDRHILSHTDD